MKKVKKSKIVDFNENELEMYEFAKGINFSKFVKICLADYMKYSKQKMELEKNGKI